MESPTVVKLSFSSEELKGVLLDFAKFFQSPETLITLKKLVDEQKISAFIEENQRNIFVKNGVDASKGFADLQNVQAAFRNDLEIMQLLMYSMMKEECIIDDSLGQRNSFNEQQLQFLRQFEAKGNQTVQYSINLPPGFQNEEEFKAAQKDPKKMQQVYARMQQEMLKLPPDQREQLTRSVVGNFSPEQAKIVEQKLYEQMKILPSKQERDAFREEVFRVMKVTLPPIPGDDAPPQNLSVGSTSMQGPSSKDLFKKE